MVFVKDSYELKEQPKLFGKWDYNEVKNFTEVFENYIAVKDTKS